MTSSRVGSTATSKAKQIGTEPLFFRIEEKQKRLFWQGAIKHAIKIRSQFECSLVRSLVRSSSFFPRSSRSLLPPNENFFLFPIRETKPKPWGKVSEEPLVGLP